MSDDKLVIEQMVEDRKQQLKSCERMIELLQPEWDKFQAKAGHDTYVARDYADHTSAARKHRKEIAALEALASHPIPANIDQGEAVALHKAMRLAMHMLQTMGDTEEGVTMAYRTLLEASHAGL